MAKYIITVEAETKDRYGNSFNGVSVEIKKDGEVDHILAFVETGKREELTAETDREDIRVALDNLLKDAEETWWLDRSEIEELKEALLNY